MVLISSPTFRGSGRRGAMSQLATQPVSQDPRGFGGGASQGAGGADYQFLDFETQVGGGEGMTMKIMHCAPWHDR
jgi:hypothetical protein